MYLCEMLNANIQLRLSCGKIYRPCMQCRVVFRRNAIMLCIVNYEIAICIFVVYFSCSQNTLLTLMPIYIWLYWLAYLCIHDVILLLIMIIIVLCHYYNIIIANEKLLLCNTQNCSKLNFLFVYFKIFSI